MKCSLRKRQGSCIIARDLSLQIHLKNTEIENTKLASEVQTLKNLDGNKENLIAYYKEEVGRLQLCVAEKEKLKRAFLLTSSNKVTIIMVI